MLHSYVDPSMSHMLLVSYIDPGTGSMLFAILIGILGAANYAFKTAILKSRCFWTGGRSVEGNDDTIPFAIFSDDKRYWAIFDPVCREFERQGVDVVYFTASEDDPGLENTYSHVRAVFLGEGNKAFAKLNMLKADVLLSTTPGLDVYQWKRSKDVKYYAHMAHAAGEVVLYRMFGLDYYDAVFVAGERQREDIRALEKLRGLPPKELPLGGMPYMDNMVERLKASGPAELHPRTVLLAPSWGPGALFARYDTLILDALIDTGYRVVVRPHPQSFKSETEMMERLMRLYPESEQISWNRDTDNYECLRNADILISDFSGVLFDFALVYDKPIIYTDPNFDLGVYDAWWLDREIWTVGALPRIGMALDEDKVGNLKQTIDQCLGDPRFAQGRDELREEIWQGYGEGAQNIVAYLLEKQKQLRSQEAGEE